MNANATRPRARLFTLLPGLSAIAMAAPVAAGICSDTAELMSRACAAEGRDDRFSGLAKCLHISAQDHRAHCNAAVEDELVEHTETCAGQYEARLAACSAIGEGRYDPDYDPALFDSDYANLSNPNDYFPLAPGNRWVFENGEERITVRVLDRTKRIRGIDCIVVLDQVFSPRLTEKTYDWFCQAKNGDVHYLGEETAEYKSFPADNPVIPEMLSNDGSFKAGRERARGGIIMHGEPQLDATYYEEYALGEAEDIARVLSTTYRYGENATLDTLVPQDLAAALCAAGDCVVTRNSSPLEPGVFERKYYAPGIGVFLETNPADEEVVRLVSCNVDPRCDTLPPP